MILRNKKTGMIGEAGYISTTDGTIIVNNINDQDEWYDYNSLAELNEEWEDYEEPEGYYYVTTTGLIKYDDTPFCAIHKDRKQIGNYFETREEAEKAVEKLKAWKRLKDKGFEFTGVEDVERTIRFEIPFRAGYDSCEAEADLNLLFGGEE